MFGKARDGSPLQRKPIIAMTVVSTSEHDTAKVLAERAEWFIPYYNNERKKDGLGQYGTSRIQESKP